MTLSQAPKQCPSGMQPFAVDIGDHQLSLSFTEVLFLCRFHIMFSLLLTTGALLVNNKLNFVLMPSIFS